MRFGLTEDTINKIQGVFTTFPKLEEAMVFHFTKNAGVKEIL